MLCRQITQGTQILARQHCAGGVVRAVQEQHPRRRGDPRLDILGPHAKPRLGAQGHGHDRGPGGPDQPFIGGIHRIAQQHLVARGDKRVQHPVKRGLRAGQADHLIRADRPPAPRRIARRQGPQQRRLAPAIAVSGAPGGHRRRRHRHQFGRGGHIGLADGQFDHILARRLHLAAKAVNLPFRTAQIGKTVGDGGVSHGAAFKADGSG